MGRTIDPMSEVATTVGASQALYLSLQAMIDPGDEVSDCRQWRAR
jgi:kynurenine--oxoglutarate transaminase/cysteine-S-conjugate beta-lyase/glutamine--phenylpyruvate transaminase